MKEVQADTTIYFVVSSWWVLLDYSSFDLKRNMTTTGISFSVKKLITIS